jgi:hypothetical protein
MQLEVPNDISTSSISTQEAHSFLLHAFMLWQTTSCHKLHGTKASLTSQNISSVTCHIKFLDTCMEHLSHPIF